MYEDHSWSYMAIKNTSCSPQLENDVFYLLAIELPSGIMQKH